MPKVLKGITAAVIRVSLRKWRALLEVAVLPFLLLSALSVVGLLLWSDSDVMVILSDHTVDPKMGSLSQALYHARFWPNMVIGALSVLAAIWLFVRISLKLECSSVPPFRIGPQEIRGVFAIFLYALAVSFLVAIASIPLLLVSWGIIAIGHREFGAIILVVNIFTVGSFLLFAFAARFFVGFVALALGQRPQIIRDLWPLAKEESFAIPFRLVILCNVYFLIYNFCVFVPFDHLVMSYKNEIINSDGETLNHQIVTQIVARYLPLALLGSLLDTLMVAVVSIFIFESYSRLKDRTQTTNLL